MSSYNSSRWGDFGKLLKKLIRTASGRIRFVMAIVGLSIALLLIFSAVQIQINYNELLHNKTNQDSVANFLVINKILNSKTYGTTTLTDNDIALLKHQPFIDDVGVLTPSRYKAQVESSSQQFPFSTEISFESVPSSFLDVNSQSWNWSQDSLYIPLIAPNMFLDFYNFQFSLSQNLPQLTQEVVKMIIFKVNIYTPNGIRTYNGHVVGFSDRITSLLVPQAFMDYANKNFATGQNVQPTRVVIRTKDPGNPALVQYLRDNGLTTDADKTRFSKYRQIVNGVVNVSWATGAVMLLFALLIFTLFIQLTIASCKDEIHLLITLGTSPKQLKRFLMKQFFPGNLYIIAAVLIIIALLQYLLYKWLVVQNIFVSPYISPYTLFAGILILLVLWIANRSTIKKYISVQK
jgi:Cell division protein